MAYKIMFDGEIASDSRDERTLLIEPVLRRVHGEAGSFSFTISPDHSYYLKLKPNLTEVRVYLDAESSVPDWVGWVDDISYDFWMQKTVSCIGDLAILSYTVQRPCDYTDGISVGNFMKECLSRHNAQIGDDRKKFTNGNSEDTGSTIYTVTNYRSSREELDENIINDVGGYFFIEYYLSNGDLKKRLRHRTTTPTNYKPTDKEKQKIMLGENLLDLAINIDSMDICTAVVPLGRILPKEDRTSDAIDGVEERLNIKSVNDGVDYIYNQKYVDKYGFRCNVVTFDNIKRASTLLKKGRNYLNNQQFANIVIRARAFDLGLTNYDLARFNVSEMENVISEYHNMDLLLRVSEIENHLEEPDADVITLGEDSIPSITKMVKGSRKFILRTDVDGTFFNPVPVIPDSDMSGNRVALDEEYILNVYELRRTPTIDEDGILTIN